MRTISSIDVACIDLELKESFSIAGGGTSVAESAVVRLTLQDGTTGLGEAAPFAAYDGQTRAGALDALAAAAPALVGLDPVLPQQVHDRIMESSPGSSCALVALEMAALDAFTRSESMQLWRYFGAKDAPLVTDLTIVAGDLDHAANSAREAHRMGFRTLKVKVGRDGVSLDRERLQVISRAAPDCCFILDANGGFSAEEAEAMMRACHSDGIPVELFEQPVEALDERGMAHLRALEMWPICADESCRSAADAMRIVRTSSADCINVKTQKSGVMEALKIIEVARAAGLSLMIGGMVESLLSMSFSAHLARGTGVFRWIDLDTPLFVVNSPFSGGIDIDGGTVTLVTDVCGHGVQIESDDLDWQRLAGESL